MNLAKEVLKIAYQNIAISIISTIGATLFFLQTKVISIFDVHLSPYVTKANLWQWLIWSTLSIVLLCSYLFDLHRKSRKNALRLYFGIYWDKEKNPYCPACKTPLNYFHDNEYNEYHTFECIKCNKEMSAKDINGNYLSLKQAKELL